jgi:hypothetical protein
MAVMSQLPESPIAAVLTGCIVVPEESAVFRTAFYQLFVGQLEKDERLILFTDAVALAGIDLPWSGELPPASRDALLAYLDATRDEWLPSFSVDLEEHAAWVQAVLSGAGL